MDGSDPSSPRTPRRGRTAYARDLITFRYGPHLLLAGMAVPGGRVLDVGMGEGALALHFQAQGHEVVGVELDPVLAAAARRRGLNVHEIDVATDDLSGLGAFDTVICADVLEHLAQPADALARLRGLLRPGGQLLVSLPNVAHASIRLSLLMGRFDYTQEGLLDKTHLRFFTRSSARRLLEHAGFRILTEAITLPVPSSAFPRLAALWRVLMERPRAGRALYRFFSLVPGLMAYQFVFHAVVSDASHGEGRSTPPHAPVAAANGVGPR